jgi:hypothetical protein
VEDCRNLTAGIADADARYNDAGVRFQPNEETVRSRVTNAAIIVAGLGTM